MNLIATRHDQLEFPSARVFFYCRFPAAGRAACVAILNIDHPFGAVNTKELGTASVQMLRKTPLNIIGDPGVERIIAALNDINRPIHHPIHSTIPVITQSLLQIISP